MFWDVFLFHGWKKNLIKSQPHLRRDAAFQRDRVLQVPMISAATLLFDLLLGWKVFCSWKLSRAIGCNPKTGSAHRMSSLIVIDNPKPPGG